MNMEKVRFGLVGTGRITDWVLKGAVLEPRFEAAAICSRREESGRAFAASHNIPKVYTDLDAMASDPDIDVIYIGTPNNTHKELSLRCMEHGKHVMCEKPLASNAAEVKEMVDAARRKGVMLMEAMISTLSPNFRNVQRKIKELGGVRHYSATYCQYSSKYDKLKGILAGRCDGPVPSSFNPDCSGGALMDVGIYTIYPMITLFGEPKGLTAKSVTCNVPVMGCMKPIDLQGNVIFEYDEMSAEVMYSKIADSLLRTEISCDAGIFSLDQIHITRNVTFTKRGAPTSGRSGMPEAVDITVPRDADEYLCEFREFIDVLQSGRLESENNSLENSLATARVMEEIRRQAGIKFPADI
jgi:predicted dehydrogenase